MPLVCRASSHFESSNRKPRHAAPWHSSALSEPPPSAERRLLLRGDGDGRSCPAAEGAERSRGGTTHRFWPQPSDTGRGGMASLGVGLHLVRRRGAGRSAAVERRNLLTVCRWGLCFLTAHLLIKDVRGTRSSRSLRPRPSLIAMTYCAHRKKKKKFCLIA